MYRINVIETKIIYLLTSPYYCTTVILYLCKSEMFDNRGGHGNRVKQLFVQVGDSLEEHGLEGFSRPFTFHGPLLCADM